MAEMILISSRIDTSATRVNTRGTLFEKFKVNRQEFEASVHVKISRKEISAQPAIKCSKLAIETLEQGVKYVQSYQ